MFIITFFFQQISIIYHQANKGTLFHSGLDQVLSLGFHNGTQRTNPAEDPSHREEQSPGNRLDFSLQDPQVFGLQRQNIRREHLL